MLYGKDWFRFWNKVRFTEGCWIWVSKRRPDGYGLFCFGRDQQRAHVVSWVDSFGPIPEGLCVLHQCDNPPCVRPDHLFLGTRGDNAADCVAKGRCPVGEQRWNARLNAELVIQIRQLVDSGSRQCEVAARFGITKQMVYEVVHRRNWRHIS